MLRTRGLVVGLLLLLGSHLITGQSPADSPSIHTHRRDAPFRKIWWSTTWEFPFVLDWLSPINAKLSGLSYLEALERNSYTYSLGYAPIFWVLQVYVPIFVWSPPSAQSSWGFAFRGSLKGHWIGTQLLLFKRYSRGKRWVGGVFSVQAWTCPWKTSSLEEGGQNFYFCSYLLVDGTLQIVPVQYQYTRYYPLKIQTGGTALQFSISPLMIHLSPFVFNFLSPTLMLFWGRIWVRGRDPVAQVPLLLQSDGKVYTFSDGSGIWSFSSALLVYLWLIRVHLVL